MKTLRLLLAAAGLLLLGYLIGQFGADRVLEAISRLQWAAPVLLLPSLLWHLSNTAAWRCAFLPDRYRPGFHALLMAKLAGEAVNQLTPLANLGGEPLKAYLLRRSTPGPRSAATVVTDKFAQLIVGLGFTVVGLALLLCFQEPAFGIPPVLIALLAAMLGLATAGLGWYHRRHDRLFSSLLASLRSAGLLVDWIERNMGRAERIDASIRSFHGEHPLRFLAVIGLQGVGWFLGTVETYVVLRALGASFDLAFCFLLTSLGSIVNALFFFMPSSFGVMEGGQVVLFNMLGLDSGLGLAMALVKRLRRLVWIAVGWVCLSWMSSRAARGQVAPVPSAAGVAS